MGNFEVPWVIYGAYGYTGELIARDACERGLRPILSGRNRERLESIAAELGLPYVACDLANAGALEILLEDAELVLHCAGPFRDTCRPMLDACLRTGTHYLDITGEIECFELVAARDADIRDAGIMALPGVGFDVVPSDYLASYLKTRLPTAEKLQLGLRSLGGISRGTARTALEYLGRNGMIRRDGRLTEVPTAWKTRYFDFGFGPEAAVSVPWGDVSTAYYSTGIGDIEVYSVLPEVVRHGLMLIRYTGPVFRSSLVRSIVRQSVKKMPAGPETAEREATRTFMVGEAVSNGQHATAILRGPGTYSVTVSAALAASEKVLGGEWRPGFQTPTTAYGCELIQAIPDFEVEDLDE